MWEAVASIGSSLLGGLFGKSGADSKNAKEIKLARENNKFNAEQAQKQMDFQERMSSTAHQREIKDLEAAGLNPVLSGTGGAGSSSPGGASASGTMPNIENNMSEMAHSARDISTKFMQNPLLNAQVANQKAENERIKEQTKQLQISNAQQGVLTPLYMEAGNAVSGGIKSVKDLLGIKNSGDIVQDVMNAAKTAPGALASGNISIPTSAFDLSRLVGTENSEARKWARGEKGFLESIFDASKPENNVSSAKRLTSEKVQRWAREQEAKKNLSKPFHFNLPKR